MPVDISTFHPIRPLHLRVHHSKDSIDIPLIEVGISLCQQVLINSCHIAAPKFQKAIELVSLFHHGGRIAELIQAKGAQVVYLPPYSPDLNRIEQCWTWLKSRIRKQRRNATRLPKAMDAVLKQAAS